MLDWTPVTVEGFTVRAVPEAALWSRQAGDETAETIVEETAWEGAAAAPGSGRTMLERWLQDGAWILGLYEDEALIGLFDVGRFVPGGYLEGPVDGAADVGADLDRDTRLPKHLTLWFAIRPAARGRVPGAVFKALSDAFLRRLWDCGVRTMITTHVLNLAEGRQHAARVERLGWRTVSRAGLSELKMKRLEQRP